MNPDPVPGLSSPGDAQFRERVEPYMREVHLHCYRMLGSVTDAEDVFQETMLAAWRGLGGLADPASLRPWLYRIATTRCLNAIRDGKRRPPPQPAPPFVPPEPSRLGDTTWLQPYADSWLDELSATLPGPDSRLVARENVELAFVVALQNLPPRQAAALLLGDVLGFSIAEVASLLEASEPSVKGLLSRARAATARSSANRPLEPAGASATSAENQLARRFADALAVDDIEGLVALLTDRAWLSMPPARNEYQGPVAIVAFLQASARWRGPRRLELAPARANRQPAFILSILGPRPGDREPAGMIVLSSDRESIDSIFRFVDPTLPGWPSS